MNNISIAEFLESASCILGEGAVIERLRRSGDLELDPFLVNSAFIYADAKRAALESIYRQYLDIGREFDLPLLISTPTWRANRERIDSAGYSGVDVNGDNVRFFDALRKDFRSVRKESCRLRPDELPRGCLQSCRWPGC